MELSNLSVFKHINARMRWLTQRQSVLAQNIANADTPGFKPKDMKPLSFAKTLGLKPVAPESGSKHIRLMPQSGSAWSRAAEEGQASALSGNAVDLEVELKKSSDTALQYQTMANLYQKHMGLLRMAIKGDS